MKHLFIPIVLFVLPFTTIAQLTWTNADSTYQPLPEGIHIFKTTTLLDGKPNIAFYISADLKDKSLDFTVDTTLNRRLTPTQYFEKNGQPLVVVNCTFFEFVHSRNLNTVIKDGKLLAYNTVSIPGRGKDTFTYKHPYASAIGISKKRKADIAWLLTDSAKPVALAIQHPLIAIKDSLSQPSFEYLEEKVTGMKAWKVRTAVGGGPVLVQEGVVSISNNEEMKFGGKAIDDKHPRTGIGYTRSGKLIILAIQGRFAGLAEGATLTQEAQMFKDLGCVEAMNLDGGGSSCLLVNGKQTIQPSDKEGQRPVPAVFIIK